MPKILVKLILWLCDYISFDDLRNYYFNRERIINNERYRKNELLKKEAEEEIHKFIQKTSFTTLGITHGINLEKSPLIGQNLEYTVARFINPLSLERLRQLDKTGDFSVP